MRSVKQTYRLRVKKSKCRGKKDTGCRSAKQCNIANGEVHHYCRKKFNTFLKGSVCKGISKTACNSKKICKYANGASRQYCRRKSKQTRKIR